MLVMNGLIEFGCDQICVSDSHFMVIRLDANHKYNDGTKIIFCQHRAKA